MSSLRVFVVTGGNKGIGKSIVKLLLQDKEEKVVYLTSRNVENGKKAVEELESLGLKANFHQLDITDKKSISDLRDFLVEKYQGIDVLVNNAGIAYSDPTSNDSLLEKAEGTLKCNFYGTLDMCDAFFPVLKENARVVHLSSMASEFGFKKLSPELKTKFSDTGLTIDGLKTLMKKFIDDTRDDQVSERGWPVNSPYLISKVGVTFMAILQQKILDAELPQRNVILNACCPGVVDTDMTGGRFKNMLTPDQGADTPVYLALLPIHAKEPKGKYLKLRKVVPYPPTD